MGCALQLPRGAVPFVDPGVTAVDDTDGDVSHAVMRYGLGAVDTAVATPDDAPYVITYAVTDSAGNAAAPVRRRVYVRDTCSPLGGGFPPHPPAHLLLSRVGMRWAREQVSEQGARWLWSDQSYAHAMRLCAVGRRDVLPALAPLLALRHLRHGPERGCR